MFSGKVRWKISVKKSLVTFPFHRGNFSLFFSTENPQELNSKTVELFLDLTDKPCDLFFKIGTVFHLLFHTLNGGKDGGVVL